MAFEDATPHEKFLLTQSLLTEGLKSLSHRIWRPEGAMYLPTYDECVTAMANNGWDHDSFTDLLDDLTNGRFKKSAAIFEDPHFNKAIAHAIVTAVLPNPLIGQTADEVAPFWRIKVRMLTSQVEFDDAKLIARRREDGLMLGADGPNSLAGAINFLYRLKADSEIIRSDRDGSNLLMTFSLGIHPRSVDVVNALIEEEGKSTSSLENLFLTDKEGNSALHYALRDIAIVDDRIALRKATIAKSLISAGLDIFQNNNFGQSPFDEIDEKVAKKTGLPFPSGLASRSGIDERLSL